MATPAERTPSTPDPREVLHALGDDAMDSAFAEWGYEAADPALQARLWGEAVWSFEERSR